MKKVLLVLLLILALASTPVGAAPYRDQGPGFLTSQPAMLVPGDIAGVTITPLLTVGDVLPNGFRFEAIPDGISLRKNQGIVEVFVNHETSKVPFPYNAISPSASGENDFDNAQVSRLTLDKKTAAVLDGSFLIESSLGFQRFCSSYLATKQEGFDRDILFTNEEAIDYVYRQEDSWPPTSGDPNEKQIGVVVAVDVETGQHYVIHGMGRHNHENSVAIPGFDELVVLSGDDTFTSGSLTIPGGGPLPAGSSPAQSQLFSYIASDTEELLEDEGDLWAFVSDDLAVTDYYDFAPGSNASVSGHFVKVPKNIATGIDDTDGSDLKAGDVGFPLPPSNGSWQRDNRTTNPTPPGLDGPQWVLEYWSQLNNVFRFVRVEDIAYDKRSGMENVVYIVDSGRGLAGTPVAGLSTNGRVWKMVLDPEDPTKVLSLSIFVEGDDQAVKTLNEIHQPDNIESTPTGLLITEDPGSSQQFPYNSTDPNATTARLWYVPFVGTPQVVVKVNQAADNTSVDVDGKLTPGNLGAWESSGIVDASSVFGKGAFLIDVQAATLWVAKATGDDNTGPLGVPDGIPDFTYKRSGGQLLLLRIPGL